MESIRVQSDLVFEDIEKVVVAKEDAHLVVLESRRQLTQAMVGQLRGCAVQKLLGYKCCGGVKVVYWWWVSY